MMRFALVCAAAFLLSSSAAAADPVASRADPEEPRIYGGQPTEICAWPNAVSILVGSNACTATLVHPEIVTTAAHCAVSNGSTATVRFGESITSPAFTVPATCYQNPGYTGGVSPEDYGYCKLSQPVQGLQIAPAAYGCELPYLSVGREVVIVGFGQTETGSIGTKKEAVTVIQSIGEFVEIGGGGTGAWQGDSGGPAYVQLSEDEGGDGTWRAFAIVSGGPGGGMPIKYTLIHKAIPWIEEHSGIDITSCYDVDGNWEPGPDCGGHPTDYGTGHGTWENDACQGPAIGFSAICGPSFGDDDEDPPTVTMTSPPSGTRYDTDGASTVDVTVTADADDGTGYGIAEVRLIIDDQEFDNNADGEEPFEWTLKMPPGGYMVSAIARDYGGLETAATPIAIGIDQDAPATDDGTEDDGSGTDDGLPDEDGDGDGGGSNDPGGLPGDWRGGPDEGCECAVGHASGSFWSSLGLLALVAIRRRRGLLEPLTDLRRCRLPITSFAQPRRHGVVHDDHAQET